MKITDSVTLGDARVNDRGYLEANARTARVGVQQYMGSELGRPELGVVNVFRDEAEVFSKASLGTFASIPVTMDHPPMGVSSETWKKDAVGTSLNEVLRDGEYLKIGLKIMDAAAVKAVQAGKRELSVGYSTELVWEDGVAPDGTPFQARQTAIVADHIAIVAQGRAGAKARIGDGAWGTSPIHDDQSGLAPNTSEKDTMSDALKTVVLGDKAVQVAVGDVAAIESFKADTAKTIADLNTTHTTTLAAKDKDLATKDAEIDALKAKIVDGAALDKLVADRSALCAVAVKIAPTVKLDGLADSDIKKAVVTSKLGDAAVKDKSADYINARFDILAEDAGKTTDPFAQVLKDGIQHTGDARVEADKARQQRDQGLRDGWKPADTAA